MSQAPESIWYHCSNCQNFSTKPMECCGRLMQKMEVDEEKDV